MPVIPDQQRVVHGKNAQLAVRDSTNTWRDLSPFSNDCVLANKEGVVDITKLGDTGKVFLPSVLDGGTITVKGFYDSYAPSSPTGSTGPFFLTSLLPIKGLNTSVGTSLDNQLEMLRSNPPTYGLTAATQSNYGQFIFCPGGSAAGITFLADAFLVDYTITKPVGGLVGWALQFQMSDAGFMGSGIYGKTAIHAASVTVFSAGWISGSGGVVSYSALMGTKK